ncbi:MAG: hypothetical protein AAF961_14450, partial [Planctomycetota bacterium]
MHAERRTRAPKRRTLLLILLALVAGLTWRLWPEAIPSVHTVTRRHSWLGEDVPPRQKFVWQPAELLPQINDELLPVDSHIRPQIA